MLRLVERGYFSTEVKLSDIKDGMPSGTQPDVQMLRVGSFNHPKYGEFDITTTTLSEMLANFEAHIRGIDLALDYFHESDKEASGWIRELYLSDDGEELWGKIDWTPKARRMLAERELRYFSPDFAFEWTDPETDVTYQNVLFGGGLTNRPFVKDMAAIVAAETQGDNMTLTDLEKKLTLAEAAVDSLAKQHKNLMDAHQELMGKHAGLQAKLDEMDESGDDGDDDDSDDDSGDEPAPPAPKDLASAKKQLAEARTKLKKSNEKIKDAEKVAKLAEKEAKFNVMLAEGKACAAQKSAYVKGDMEEFLKLAEPVNLVRKGHGTTPANDEGDRDEKVMKLAEEKRKGDPKMTIIDSITMANREIPRK